MKISLNGITRLEMAEKKMVSELEGRLIKKITFEQTGKRLKKERKKEPYRSVRCQAV